MIKTPRRVALLFDRIAGYQCQVLMGIHHYVREQGRWQCFGMPSSLSLIPELSQLKPDGILAILNTPEIASSVAALKLPVVNVSNFIRYPEIPRVGVDEYAVGRMAACHLTDRGFRNIAYVPHSTGVFSYERQVGFVTALHESGIDESRIFIYEKGLTSRFWQGSNDPDLRDWLRALPRPIGVFGGNDALAMKVVEEALRVGRHVPEDLAVIGVDNSELHCELMRPRLTSIVQPALRIGFEAATLLENLMNREPRPTRPLLLNPTRVVCRESTDVLAIQDPVLARAIGFIHQHAAEDISVADVLAQTGWSRRKLEDRFRRQLSRGPHEEITRVRLESARRLLVTTDLKLLDIARQCGFLNATRLSQVFQKAMNVSPSQFRQENAPPRGIERDASNPMNGF